MNLDLIVCDEGHRLKTANIKTAQAIRSLSTKRRIILTGTPIQNDLGEFFAMIDFVNPGLFDNYGLFKKVFEDPIVRSRQPDCSKAEAALGLERYRVCFGWVDDVPFGNITYRELTNSFLLHPIDRKRYEPFTSHQASMNSSSCSPKLTTNPLLCTQ